MNDPTTLSYINLFAVLGALEDLCRLDPKARAILAQTDISVTFITRGGPEGTLIVDKGTCRMEPGTRTGQIRLYLSSPDKLNAMMQGKATPLPLKGFTKLRFLTGPFAALTKRLEEVMRPDEAHLKDPAFRAMHTEMILHVAVAALVEVANHDPALRAWAQAMPDGVIALSIAKGPALSVEKRDGRLRFHRGSISPPRARMEFCDIDAAFDVLSGRSDSFSAIATERLSLSGFIPMLDALEKLLTRAGIYLN